MCNGDGGTAFMVIFSHKEKNTKRVSLAGIVVKTKGGSSDFSRRADVQKSVASLESLIVQSSEFPQ
jgi:hypothetical protein